MSKNPSLRKKLKYWLAEPLLRTYLRGLQRSSTLQISGAKHLDELLVRPFIPCYWHQQNLICALYLLKLKERGIKSGFLVSPSRDGEIPAKVFSSWGAEVIRGSSSRTGAQAMRELYLAITQKGISPGNTPDGPRGPIFEFKSGPLMLAQMTGAPVVPMAGAARSYKQLKSWDRFILPGWFNRLAIHVGEPVYIDKSLSMNELEPIRMQLQQQLVDLSGQAECSVKKINN